MARKPTALPDKKGRFGPYGGRYVPETLMFALRQLTEHYEQARDDPAFQRLGHGPRRPPARRQTREAGDGRNQQRPSHGPVFRFSDGLP